MKKLLKNPLLLLIIGFILGYITSVIADTINSNEVLYDNSNINSNVDNVQDALDEVYNIINHNSLGFSLLTHNPVGLSTELIGGLYRYQGVQNNYNNVDNYICFGTTNKSDCVGDTDKYMYRIIGINTSGQIKLIKKEALNTDYNWNSNGGVKWANSDIFAGLNGPYYLDNLEYIPDNTWRNRIDISIWHYSATKDRTISTIIERELAGETVNAKIGLMYLHDYAYSLATPEYSSSSWLYLRNNDSNPPDGWELIITLWDNLNPWYISGTPDYTYGGMGYTYAIRPVFYLTTSQTIASGSGTITDPYILS